jgi:hypothetical protein
VVSLVTSLRIGFAQRVATPYRVAPIFLLRMAGVPFAILQKIATPETSAATRDILAIQTTFESAKATAAELLSRRDNGLSPEEFHDLRSAIRANGPPKLSESNHSGFVAYAKAARQLVAATARADEILAVELSKARAALLEAARVILPNYLVFGAAGADKLLVESLNQQLGALPARNKRARERERHLLLYLQRIAAKNDTFSEFGPTGWGKIDNVRGGVEINVQPGIAAREIFLERWIAHAAAAVLNADPEIFSELSPRQNPNGRIQSDRFIFADSGESIELDSTQLELIEHCDGATPVHALGAPIETIGALVEKKVLRCEVEVRAMDPYAFASLYDDVGRWRSTPARERWLSILQPIADLPKVFARATNTEDRHRILLDAKSLVETLGASKRSDRFLYSATNPIGEECFRECEFCISEELIDEAAVDAAPWIDLWRDCYAVIASRVAEGLRQIFHTARRETIPLPAFLRLCESARLSLTGPGLIALAQIAFQEVKALFREQMLPHANSAEYELTADDCHFVRKKFQYDKFDEYTYPSADLQISARSTEAVAAGDYQWILAELHPPVALLHHGAYWSCPDKDSLNKALAKTIGRKPNFHFGFFAADFTSHTTVRLFDALPEFTYFIAPQRGNPKWRTAAPADTEVYVDPTTSDVCLRKIDNHEYLGSFARAWLIPLGFHPFQFGMSPHMPRLRCGKVIVQRRAWTITLEELGHGDFTGVSRALVLAVEQLRSRRNLPRFVYIRPTEQALRRSGAEGRDKDTKPVFVDLESYLFLEIFHRWLVKAGELEVTEMLPSPDDLLWREPDGRRTFELRTLIVPRS